MRERVPANSGDTSGPPDGAAGSAAGGDHGSPSADFLRDGYRRLATALSGYAAEQLAAPRRGSRPFERAALHDAKQLLERLVEAAGGDEALTCDPDTAVISALPLFADRPGLRYRREGPRARVPVSPDLMLLLVTLMLQHAGRYPHAVSWLTGCATDHEYLLSLRCGGSRATHAPSPVAALAAECGGRFRDVEADDHQGGRLLVLVLPREKPAETAGLDAGHLDDARRLAGKRVQVVGCPPAVVELVRLILGEVAGADVTSLATLPHPGGPSAGQDVLIVADTVPGVTASGDVHWQRTIFLRDRPSRRVRPGRFPATTGLPVLDLPITPRRLLPAILSVCRH